MGTRTCRLIKADMEKNNGINKYMSQYIKCITAFYQPVFFVQHFCFISLVRFCFIDLPSTVNVDIPVQKDQNIICHF